jgi:hypothetical protein
MLIIINYQLSIINYQLSIINYQLSIINYQLSIINYQLFRAFPSLRSGRHIPGFASLRASHPFGPSMRLTQPPFTDAKP